MGRNPPEESQATNLNRVKKHHMCKHFRRITTTKNVENWWLVSKALLVQCVLSSPENVLTVWFR